MKTLQKLGYTALGTFVVMNEAFAQTSGSNMFGQTKVNSGLQGAGGTADQTIQNLITRAMVYLTIVAVIFGLYGGFLMLTAGEDDGKVKNGKKILINVGLGLLVMWLAGSIVNWVIGLLTA